MTRSYESYGALELGPVANEGYGADLGLLGTARGHGAYLELESGQKLIDTAMAAGSALLGHSHPVVVEAIQAQSPHGLVFGMPTNNALNYGALLTKIMPWYEHYVFCNTGSEATMRAIRIARAVSGRSKIAMFSGGWHGSHDMVLIDEAPGSEEATPTPRFKSPGTPTEMLEQVVFLPYNHDNAFELIRQHKDELAVVLIEPAQGSNPRSDMGEFLKELREVTQDCGILLCFDEIITGARLGLSGAQRHYGVYADLATFGKTLGGGLPIGIVGGTPEIMKVVRHGTQQDPRPIFMGGTFSANPLSTTAGMAVINHLRETGGDFYENLELRGKALRERVNQSCKARGIEAHMMGVASMMRLVFTSKPINSRHQRDRDELPWSEQGAFFRALRYRGVHTGSNRILFLSAMHDDAIITQLGDAIIDTLGEFHEQGVL